MTMNPSDVRSRTPRTRDVQQAPPRTRIAPTGLERLAVHFGVVIDADALAGYVADERDEGITGPTR